MTCDEQRMQRPMWVSGGSQLVGSAEPQCGVWTCPVRCPHVPQCRPTPLLSLPLAVGLPVLGGGGRKEGEGSREQRERGGRRSTVAGHVQPKLTSEPVNSVRLCSVDCSSAVSSRSVRSRGAQVSGSSAASGLCQSPVELLHFRSWLGPETRQRGCWYRGAPRKAREPCCLASPPSAHDPAPGSAAPGLHLGPLLTQP